MVSYNSLMDSKSINKMLTPPKVSSRLNVISPKIPMGLFTEFKKWTFYVEIQRAMTILKNRRLALSDNDVVTKWNSIQQIKGIWMHLKKVNIELKNHRIYEIFYFIHFKNREVKLYTLGIHEYEIKQQRETQELLTQTRVMVTKDW